MNRNSLFIPIPAEDGEEIRIPAQYAVCDRCNGTGSHTNPAIDGHGIGSDEWNGPDWDDDSREMYLSGGYDVPCHECDGKRVVLIADCDAMTDVQRAAYEGFVTFNNEFNAISRAERRAEMGASYFN